MTREEFIQILEEKGYSYEMEGDKLVVTNEDDVDLGSLETFSPGVVFKNDGHVDLYSLKRITPDVEFDNSGNVFLNSLVTLPPGVEFKNGAYVELKSLIGGWLDDWGNNIEGIDIKRLLNLMIKRGLFI